jgi:hypothetical protein
VLEFLTVVSEAGGDLIAYFNLYIKKSGIAESSAVFHELKNLFEILRFSIQYDQLDPTNAACLEQVVRRIVQIQMAVRRNPKHPTFDGLDLVMATRVDETAGVVLQDFNTWFAEEQGKEGKRMKANRLWREETVAKQADFSRASGSDQREQTQKPWKPDKPKPKPKAKAKAEVKPDDQG